MTGIEVRGNATAEEVAAVIAALQQRTRSAPRDRYALWRATRLAAVRSTLPRRSSRDGGQTGR